MPAKKPLILNTRHDTKADKAARTAAESAMTPRTGIPVKAPVVLKGHGIAIETWKRVTGLYREIDGQIATAFDVDGIVKYCLLEEEVVGMAKLRDGVLKDYEGTRKQANRIRDFDQKSKLFELANALLARYQGMDARLDGKRKLLHALSQSLYLTPRSRAGVAPAEKESDEPVSEMDGLL